MLAPISAMQIPNQTTLTLIAIILHISLGKDSFSNDKSTVIGLVVNGACKVYPISLFKKNKKVSDEFHDIPLLLYYDNSTNNTIVYNRKLGNNIFEFRMSMPSFFDRNKTDIVIDNITGTKRDLRTGKAIEGCLRSQALKKVDFKKVYWFIWADYFPESDIYE